MLLITYKMLIRGSSRHVGVMNLLFFRLDFVFRRFWRFSAVNSSASLNRMIDRADSTLFYSALNLRNVSKLSEKFKFTITTKDVYINLYLRWFFFGRNDEINAQTQDENYCIERLKIFEIYLSAAHLFSRAHPIWLSWIINEAYVKKKNNGHVHRDVWIRRARRE